MAGHHHTNEKCTIIYKKLFVLLLNFNGKKAIIIEQLSLQLPHATLIYLFVFKWQRITTNEPTHTHSNIPYKHRPWMHKQNWTIQIINAIGEITHSKRATRRTATPNTHTHKQLQIFMSLSNIATRWSFGRSSFYMSHCFFGIWICFGKQRKTNERSRLDREKHRLISSKNTFVGNRMARGAHRTQFQHWIWISSPFNFCVGGHGECHFFFFKYGTLLKSPFDLLECFFFFGYLVSVDVWDILCIDAFEKRDRQI